MLRPPNRRTPIRLAAVLSAGATVLLFSAVALAQSGDSIKIGYGISQTGGLAPNGESALLAQKLWEDDTNARGGLLGRPDQSNPTAVPGIYAKLLDVDKVDLTMGGYGTNMLAPAMPLVIQRNKLLIGLFGLAVNSEFNYPRYFSMVPNGPQPKLALKGTAFWGWPC
jgi:branched-chain amino acid transport system substrate-binding protein